MIKFKYILVCLFNMLDKLDKKIIFELGENSRKSYKEIAKKIHSKKEVVAYRINSLIENKIITKFVPVIALSKLNIFSHKIYIRLQGLDIKNEKLMHKFLQNNPRINWIAKTQGRWDLLIGIYTRNIFEFSKIKDEILSKFSKYIQDYNLTEITDALVFNRDYLVGSKTNYRDEFIFGGNHKIIQISKEEQKLLLEIKNNARFKATEIGEKLNIDSRTVMNKIKSLKEKGILQGYTVFIDQNKIGNSFHKLCIYLNQYSETEIKKLISYLKINPSTIHFIKSIGSWEYEIEIEQEPNSNIYEYIQEIKNTFPNLIKQIALVTIIDETKLDFFPNKEYFEEE